MPSASERRICRVLQVPRGATRPQRALTPVPRAEDAELLARVKHWIETQPTFGYRRVWALLRFRDGHLCGEACEMWRSVRQLPLQLHEKRLFADLWVVDHVRLELVTGIGGLDIVTREEDGITATEH